MKRPRRFSLALAWLAALLLALSLRVHHLSTQSLWYDEAVTAQVASQGIGELTRWTADDIQPPLYYYLVAGWTRLVGRGEWALRFPSVFFGVLTVALLWVAARRLWGAMAAGATAVLSAIAPLYVYYAQEARMYTLLTFLGVLTGYALLRASGGGIGRKRGAAGLSKWWWAFVIAGTAMLYTHYFGVFLLLAYGICWVGWFVWGRWPDRPTRRMSFVAFGLSTFTIIVLYLPWLPALLNRYRVDASYWQGALKLGEALRHIVISFTVAAPEMMLERDAVRFLPWYGGAFALAVVAVVWRSRRPGGRQAAQVLVYLAIYFLAPIFCVLFLASRTPKFNPRYLMLASPAYLLILAGGIAALAGGAAERKTVRGQHLPAIPRAVYGVLALALLGFLVATGSISIRNWFSDPAFTKAQWREVAGFVRQERGPGEAVLLVSGHAYPAWHYYAPEIPAVRLPPADILDVNKVLGFDAGQVLAQALAGKEGVWLVTWQDEVVDPVGFTPYFLDRNGMEQRVEPRFWHIGLRHWRLEPGSIFAAEPRPEHTDTANFDHKLALLGWDDPVDGQFIVYWRVLNTLQQDYQVSVVVEDAAGNRVGQWDGRPAAYDYPAFRWQAGQALFGRYPLPVPPDAPAGDYYVTLLIYDASDPSGLDIRDVADNPAGKHVRLGPIRVE